MNRLRALRCLTSCGLAGALFATGTAAAARTTDSLDLEAGAGFSSNPGLQINGRSSVFGRVSASGTHSWITERGVTSLTGYVEESIYSRQFGSKPIISLGAHTSQSVSPKVTVYGDLGFQTDFAGQLSNRLLTVPSAPPVVEPGNPLPPPVVTPDLLGFSGREYRINGSVGASIQTSARSSLTLTAGAQRSIFSRNRDNDFTSYFASGGYSQQVSERTSLGATLFLQRQDFSQGDHANVINPVVTAHTTLRENLVADGSVGLMVIDQSIAGQHFHSYTPSFAGSLCSSGSLSSFCVTAARNAQTALGSRLVGGNNSATITTSLGANYFRRLGEGQTLQASLSAVQYTTPSNLNVSKLRTTYISGVVGYDRAIGHRLYAGVAGGARKLFQVGPDPKLDFNANVYVRYRLGDLQ
jgi:hypothetical protein